MFDVSRTIGRWPGILAALGVNEKYLTKRHGSCPFCLEGKDRYRFSDHEGSGMWICTKCGSGNGVHFVMRFLGVEFKEAAERITEALQYAKKEEVKPQVDNTERLKKIWLRSKPITEVDDVWLYLRNRNLMPNKMPTDLRCVESEDYYDDGKAIGKYSAMIAVIRDKNRLAKSMHITYLKDGKKATVPSPKKVLSKTGSGAAIHLSRPTDILCITEGIETGLAVLNRTGKPVWSAISSGNFKSFELPDGVKRLEVWADNDRNFVGQLAAYGLASRIVSKCDVEVFVPSKIGTDWADE